jgi:hypothetical protein
VSAECNNAALANGMNLPKFEEETSSVCMCVCVCVGVCQPCNCLVYTYGAVVVGVVVVGAVVVVVVVVAVGPVLRTVVLRLSLWSFHPKGLAEWCVCIVVV